MQPGRKHNNMAGRSGIGVLVTGFSRVGALKKHAPLVFTDNNNRQQETKWSVCVFPAKAGNTKKLQPTWKKVGLFIDLHYMHTTWISHVHHMEITSTPCGPQVGMTCSSHGYHIVTDPSYNLPWVIIPWCCWYIFPNPWSVHCGFLFRTQCHCRWFWWWCSQLCFFLFFLLLSFLCNL